MKKKKKKKKLNIQLRQRVKLTSSLLTYKYKTFVYTFTYALDYIVKQRDWNSRYLNRRFIGIVKNDDKKKFKMSKKEKVKLTREGDFGNVRIYSSISSHSLSLIYSLTCEGHWDNAIYLHMPISYLHCSFQPLWTLSLYQNKKKKLKKFSSYPNSGFHSLYKFHVYISTFAAVTWIYL